MGKDDGDMGTGYVILSYLMAGVLFYGGLGWLGDYLLSTRFLLPLGLILGFGVSVFLVVKRFGQTG